MRMLIFGAQHPDHVRRLVLRRRRRPRDEGMAEVLAAFEGTMRGRLLRFFESGAELAPADLAQPLATAAQYLDWQEAQNRGVFYDGALGVSMGEAVASVATGAASLSDVVRLAEAVSALERLVERRGALSHIAAPVSDVVKLARGLHVHPAVHYGPCSTIVGGSFQGLEELARRCKRAGIATNALPLAHAYHTPAVAELESVFAEMAPATPTAPQRRLYSCVTGTAVFHFQPEHWWSIVSRPCLFTDAVAAALHDGFREFVAVDGQRSALETVREVADERGLANVVRLRMPEAGGWRNAG